MDIKYFVRTMEGRKVDIPINYEPIIDYEHRYVKSYINALYKINDYNAVLMEDDIILCNNFEEEITKVIEDYPNSIINFFTAPDRFFTTHYTERFNYNQCTYFPKGIASILADEMMKLYIPEETLRLTQRYGHLLNRSLHNLSIPIVVYRPALVQHIDGISTYDNTMNSRNTIYFKNYLDKLGIEYMDAYKPENKKKLQELLDADREIWYKNI